MQDNFFQNDNFMLKAYLLICVLLCRLVGLPETLLQKIVPKAMCTTGAIRAQNACMHCNRQFFIPDQPAAARLRQPSMQATS